MASAQLAKLTVSALRLKLADAGVDVAGKKSVLIAKLIALQDGRKQGDEPESREEAEADTGGRRRRGRDEMTVKGDEKASGDDRKKQKLKRREGGEGVGTRHGGREEAATTTRRDAPQMARAERMTSLKKLRVAELRAMLAAEGLGITGTKPVLIARMITVYDKSEQEEQQAQQEMEDEKQKGEEKPSAGGDGAEESAPQEKEVEHENELGGDRRELRDDETTQMRETDTEMRPPGITEAPSTIHGLPVVIHIANMNLSAMMPQEIVDTVKWLVAHYGGVLDVELVKDHDTEQYGDEAIVTMADDTGADAACLALNMRYASVAGGTQMWSVRRSSSVHNGPPADTAILARAQRADHVHKGKQSHERRRYPQGRVLTRPTAETANATAHHALTPAQLSGAMPHSGPLAVVRGMGGRGGRGAQRGKGAGRHGTRNDRRPCGAGGKAWYRGGDVAGLPPSAAVDKKWAHLYA